MDDKLRRSIGKRIRCKREEKRWTIEQFAEMVDLSAVSVGQVERGQGGIGLEKFITIAAKLETSIDWIMTGNEHADYYRINQLDALARDMSVEEFSAMLEIATTSKSAIRKIMPAR